MATEPEFYRIDPAGDLYVMLHSPNSVLFCVMQVSRKVLVESSVWFKKQVAVPKEVRLLNMDQKHAVTFYTWLSILHGTVPDFLYSIENIPLQIVFAVTDASRYYGFGIARLGR
jgi:hypothetical protein